VDAVAANPNGLGGNDFVKRLHSRFNLGYKAIEEGLRVNGQLTSLEKRRGTHLEPRDRLARAVTWSPPFL